MLTEDDFEVRVITLAGGLDPDRYIREQGLAAYSAAVRGAQRHADYLIERARVLHPGSSPEAKVKALNFLLPHIRRLPNALLRDEFAKNAAQKLGIDSTLMLQELKRAATQRLESVRAPQATALSELERVLLRALVMPEVDRARARAATELGTHPEWFAGLASAGLMETLVHAPAPDNPMDAAGNADERNLLAVALHEPGDESRDSLEVQVSHALTTLHVRHVKRRLVELRGLIAEAERKGDPAMLQQLTEEKVRLDRLLRQL